MDCNHFLFTLITFDHRAQVDERCNVTPVRQIDPRGIEIRGDGGSTDIRLALNVAHEGLRRYLSQVVEPHPERSEHPVPLLLLFSDGQHNGPERPEEVADQIKHLRIDEDPVVIACAGVAIDDYDEPDEELLQRIASPGCYVRVENVRHLSAFLAEIGSRGYSTAPEVAMGIQGLIEDQRGRGDR